MNRRKVLKRLALGALIAGSGVGCSKAPAPVRERALIVGGGLCGLSILDRLVARQWDVVLLEAAPRLGGRVLTRRDLPEGLHAEAGAERIPPHHRRVHALLRSLGLTPEPYPAETEAACWKVGGESVRFRTAADLPLATVAGMSPVERKGAPHRIATELVLHGPPIDDGPTPTAWEWLQRHGGMTPAAAPWVRALSPWPLDRLPAATFRRFVLEQEASGEMTTLRGGMDAIAARLASPHGKRIRSGVHVEAVTLQDKGATVHTADGTSLEAPWVFLCLPVPVLSKRIAWGQGGMPAPLRQRLDGLAVEQEIKVHLQVDPSMFGPEGAAPFTLRGDYPRVTWPTPSRGRDGSRILNTMAVCEDVQELAGVLARGPESVRRLLETRLPEMAPLRGVTWHDWSQDPLAGGVWIWHRNGAPNVSHPARAGRVVFAGSDLSSHSGWIEGALASAEAATALVTER